MNNVQIVSAWPHTGKTTLAKVYPFTYYFGDRNNKPTMYIDIDSGEFKAYLSREMDSRTSNVAWVKKYVEMVEHLYRMYSKSDIDIVLLISSHSAVQKALLEDGFSLVIAMPIWNSQHTYIQKLFQRASENETESNIAAHDAMAKNFRAFYRETLNTAKEYEEQVRLIKMPDGWYLADYI